MFGMESAVKMNEGRTSALVFSALFGRISAIIISISGIAFAGRISIIDII